MVALPTTSSINGNTPAGNDSTDVPAFQIHPVAPGQYSIPANGDGDLVVPREIIEQAATFDNDQEARDLVTTHASAVYIETRKGRPIAAQHHRTHVELALKAGYKSTARLAAILGDYMEWIVIPGGDQPRTTAIRIQVFAYLVMGLMAMAADFVLSYVFLLDTAPERMGVGMMLALVLPALLSVPMAKGYPLLRHATPQARLEYERKFAVAFWPAILVLLIAAGFRYTLLSVNPVQMALAETTSLTDSQGIRWLTFSLQLGAQVIASTAAFCCALRLLHETRKSIREVNPDHAQVRAKLEQETARLQENQDTFGWSDARVEAYKAERLVFINECLAELGRLRDERKALKLEISLLRRRSTPSSRISDN
jgi:hypothetical protein